MSTPVSDEATAPWPAPTVNGPISATVALPGSKSLTNRYLVLAALADEPSRLRAPLRSRDTLLMASAVRALGTSLEDATATGSFGADWLITPGQLRGPASIDVGLAGTVMRFVPPVAALGEGAARFDGDPHARTRPMGEVLTGLRGPRPQHHGRPRKLQTLAEEVSSLLAPDRTGPALQVNPDSPADVLKAFKRQGVTLTSTRAWELKTVDHPAVAPLLRYKELARLHVAHGWGWQDQWVREGRFHAEYVPGGVVTGRWATSGGGALQIPKVMRACVVADPGYVLVAADAGQLEPRILAALSGDRGMIAATADADMYTALARQALGRPEARNEAKIGLLAAMYGARANTPAMVALKRRFPQALDLLERAARTGENGGTVRSVLGRTCPPPEPTWQDVPPEQALARSRARGRFTRNFVIQASAADWANALVAGLRRRLNALSTEAELVFFQHDEVVVHAPAALAEATVAAIADSGAEATALVLGERGVRIPLAAAPIGSYAEKN